MDHFYGEQLKSLGTLLRCTCNSYLTNIIMYFNCQNFIALPILNNFIKKMHYVQYLCKSQQCLQFVIFFYQSQTTHCTTYRCNLILIVCTKLVVYGNPKRTPQHIIRISSYKTIKTHKQQKLTFCSFTMAFYTILKRKNTRALRISNLIS